MIKVRDSAPYRSGATIVVAIVVAAWLICSGLIAFAQTKNSCLDCHSNLPEPLGVSVETYGQNIHAQKGLTCAACHGGDANSDDPEKALLNPLLGSAGTWSEEGQQQTRAELTRRSARSSR